jgi:hypothetical protein
MAKYIITETWNGEGYSYENKAYLMDFNSDAEAQAHIESLVQEDAENVKASKGMVFYEIGEDGGWYTYTPYQDQYGVVILCNVNISEPYIVTEEQFLRFYEQAVDQADPDEEIEEGDEVFIGAYDDEYDYMFIKLKP